MSKTRVLVITDYYRPAREAGGIVTSLENLFSVTSKKFNFFVLTKNNDLLTPTSFYQDNILWRRQNEVRVQYRLSFLNLGKIIKFVINKKNKNFILPSFFSPLGTIVPLLFLKLRKIWLREKNLKVIVFAKGQLYPQSIEHKRIKKLVYLKLAKFLALLKDVKIVYSSNQELEQSILFHPKYECLFYTIPEFLSDNFYKIKLARDDLPEAKVQKYFNILFVGRVHRIKRIREAMVLFASLDFKQPLMLKICGPIEDKNYWNELEQLAAINENKLLISYKGTLSEPELVQEYVTSDLLCVFSKNENFSYVIPEALSNGCPVALTSKIYWANFSNDILLPVSESFGREDVKNLTKFMNLISNNREGHSKSSKAFINSYIEKMQPNFVEDFYRLFTCHGSKADRRLD